MENNNNRSRRKSSLTECFFDYGLLEMSLMLGDTNIVRLNKISGTNTHNQKCKNILINAIAFNNLQRL